MSSLNQLVSSILGAIDGNRPFVIFSEPGTGQARAYFQNTDQVESKASFSGEGFVFAPYQFEDNGLFLHFDQCDSLLLDPNETTGEGLQIEHGQYHGSEQERASYLKLVQDALSLINFRMAKKVVTSRKTVVPLASFQWENLIKNLFGLYPDAFTYIWYHPASGVWCGATPELLVQTDGLEFHAMALAGTRPYQQYLPADWSVKEEEEQQLVVDFIVNRLQKVTSVVKLSKTRTHRAGTVVHLRTDISGILKKNKTTLESLVKTLHPTSAVCGMPRKLVTKFLQENEGYDRDYYTGFLGVFNSDKGLGELYVNLRCMQLDPKEATIYVGGGITEASDAEAEWQETENKKQTMLDVLAPML